MVETVNQLIVAFVLAMTARSFVTEGFVIPTGSMAPTLLGQHVTWHSDQTGMTFDMGWGTDSSHQGNYASSVSDPMLGLEYEVDQARRGDLNTRMGDRVLVLKSLYLISEPHRFDVVVFKNPTDPTGGSANYIKRLIGLPDEKIWLADGDVFAGDASLPGMEGYSVQRKPDYVQRAVWQPVYHSDYFPVDPARLLKRRGAPDWAAPWAGDGWETQATRSYVCSTADPTTLTWSNGGPHSRRKRPNDWNPYNTLTGPRPRPDNVSDIRVRAGVVADDPAVLNMTLLLKARHHLFEFIITNGTAQVRMKADFDDDAPWAGSEPKKIKLPGAGRAFEVDFWHVDQALSIFIDGKRVARYLYDWTPAQRLKYASDELYKDESDVEEIAGLARADRLPAEIEWRFDGSPVTLHRVQLDRDLHYRSDRFHRARYDHPTAAGYEKLLEPGTPGYGTSPDKPAVLNSDQFYMLGDNSAASSDGRLWGNPHPLVAAQIDDAPFVVNRKLLLGKAWVVYFPAPHPITDGGAAIIPDTGRLRFIR